MEGVKLDQDKPRWDLLPFREVKDIVDVFTFGAKKYSDNGWQSVENAQSRYFSALMRHLTAWWSGEQYDPESRKHHLAHAGCCLLILLWHSKHDENKKDRRDLVGEYFAHHPKINS